MGELARKLKGVEKCKGVFKVKMGMVMNRD